MILLFVATIMAKITHFFPTYTIEQVNSIDDSSHTSSEEYLVDFYDSKVYLKHLSPYEKHRKKVMYCHGKHNNRHSNYNWHSYHYRRWKFGDDNKTKKHS